MQVNTRQSRQGPHIQSVYADNEYVGVVKEHRSGRGLVAIRKSDGESSTVLFATVDEAAEWLVGNV
jgi:hypothetical protein